MPVTDFRTQTDRKNRKKTEGILKVLPPYMKEYLDSLDLQYKSEGTIYIYFSRDKVLFEYLGKIFGKKSEEITEADLDQVTPELVEMFLADVKRKSINGYRKKKGSSLNNYLSAVRSFFSYAKARGMIKRNPAAEIRRVRQPVKDDVVHIDREEEPAFLNAIENGQGLTPKQEAFRTEYSSMRDDAICQTILMTGVRVSELVGIDIDDVNFSLHQIHIFRKEGKDSHVYMPDSLEALLEKYMTIRNATFHGKIGKALFLVAVGKYRGARLSVRSVQNIVKKYAKASGVSDAALITPHRLRATFAMDLLEATSDLSLTQQALSHQSPSTTAVYIGKRERELKKNRNVLERERIFQNAP